MSRRHEYQRNRNTEPDAVLPMVAAEELAVIENAEPVPEPELPVEDVEAEDVESPAVVSEAALELPASILVGEWSGYPNYLCRICQHATTNLETALVHYAERHGPKPEPEGPAPLLFGPDGEPMNRER